MPNRIIFSSKTKVGIEAGKIPTSVDVLVQTDNSPNMDDFRNWASDTNALISLNRTLQNEGIGNTSSGAQYFNRYGSANLYQTKLIPTTDYAGRTVAAQGDNRSWIRKDYIENYKITSRGALNKSKTIFSVNLGGTQQTERLYTILVPTAGGSATEPPQSNVLGNPPQLPGIFDGSITRKLTTATGNGAGFTSVTIESIYGSAVASFGIYAGGSISGVGIPPNTFIGSSYVSGSTTIPLVDSQGSPVQLTENCQSQILYVEIPDSMDPMGVPHYNTPANGAGASFAVYYNEDAGIEEVIVVNPGDNYSSSNQTTTNKLIIPGSFVGGDDGDNDITLTSYNLNTYALLITTTDFQEKSVNLQDIVNSEETGIDTFTYTGTSAGVVTKSATMVKDQTFITVSNNTLIQKGMRVTSSTGYGIPVDTIVADSYIPGDNQVPLATLNGITPQKVTLTYSTPINVTFEYAATFTNVSGTNISGSGSGAQFIVTKNVNNTYNVFMTNSGSNYVTGTQIKINGSQIGGVTGVNDLIINVQKVLDKFPAGTRITFFEKSVSNPGYYELYLSSFPRTGFSVTKTTSTTGNTTGNNFITVTNGSQIAAGQEVSAVGGIPSGTYVANSYVSGSTTVPLSEADGTTEVLLTADTNSTSVTFSSPVVIENGDGLVFYRSYNSFWSQLNSGSIFEGRPTNYVAWYRATKLQTRFFPVTLLPPSNSNNKYRLYTQRFRVDSDVNLKTATKLNSDWSLHIQVGKNQDPKWETAVIVSIDIQSTYVLNGKTRYICELVMQYPSKYSWDLDTEEISYCYVYKNTLGGIFSDYITQTVPYNKALVTSEYVWKAPNITPIQVTNTATTTDGGIFNLANINETPITGTTPTFRLLDKDTFSMYIRTWKDIVPATYSSELTSDQIKLISLASDPRYIYLSPRSVQFRSSMNGNTYVNVDTGTLSLGTSPQSNSNINYTTNVVRLDAYPTYAPTAPGIWTYSFGRQYLYYQQYAWNYYSDNLTAGTTNGNPSSLSTPYKFVSTVPYSQVVTTTSTGTGNPIIISLDAHGLQSGDAIVMGGSLPAGISSGSINSRGNVTGTTYYVSSTGLTVDTFQISSTVGGASLSSSSGSITTPDVRTSSVTALLKVANTITSSQVDGIQLTGLHGLVIRGSYKIQAGTTEPIQLQDQYYYIKREFPNKDSIDGDALTISTISRTNNLVTVVTTTAHRYSTGERVTVSSAITALNTTDESPAIITVVNSTTFRYTLVGSDFSSTGGTVQARAGWKRYIKLNSEIISYDYYTVDGNNRYTLYGVSRGQLGTTAQSHSNNPSISLVLDTWSPSGARITNNLFNTDGTLKSNVSLTYQNNWTYTREFPDYGGSNGLMYYGTGRRDSFQPSRWEVALFGPAYFAPGTLSFVTYSDQYDASRVSGRYTGVTGTASALGASAQFTITIGLVATTTGSYTSGTNTVTVGDATGIVAGQKITSSASGIPSNTTVTNVSGTTLTLSANLTVTQTTPTLYFFDPTDRTLDVSVSNGGNSYKLGETITIAASSIGGAGANLVVTASYLNFGNLYDGMDFGQPGISKKLVKNPYYQALYKESSEVKYYQEPATVEQRSYEDLFGAFSQAMVKSKNLVSGIPDDTTPYYNVRSTADAILLQASRDQYYSYLSGLIKRPKYLTAQSTSNSSTLVINDATGVEVGDAIYGPGISTDGAIIKSITGSAYFTLAYRNGVIKLGNNTYKKTTGRWAWDADVYSTTGYTTNVYASAKAGETSSYIMFGLNSDQLTNASYTTIDYAWYVNGNGRAYIYENGRYIGDYGVYYTTTDFRVEYDGTNVVYYKDGAAQRTVARTIGAALYFDSSFYNVGGSLKDVKFGDTTVASSNSTEATIQIRSRRVVTKDIQVIRYEYPVSDASLGVVARLSIPNSFGISQPLVDPNIGPFKYYLSEIKFEYVDPIYQTQFKTFFFEEDKYSAPVLKTEVDNSTGNLFLYFKNPTLLNSLTKEKFDSSLYSLKSKIEIISFEDYKLNPEVTRVGVNLSTSSKQINIGSITGIQQGMTVTNFNTGGLTNYTGTVAPNTTVVSIDSDELITLNNFPTAAGLSSLKFTSNVTYPVGTQYIIDPSPNLNKNSRYILDTAKPTYFTSKWIPGQTELDLFFSPDVNDPSTSINYPFNIDEPVKYYAVDSGDRLLYKISSIALNGSSSFLSRSTSDTTFANLAIGQKVYFTNIPAGVSLSENTVYYITYVLNNDIRISNQDPLQGTVTSLDITGGSSLSNLNLRMRRIYTTGADRDTLRTSLTYFDYPVQSGISEIPSGDIFAKTVSSNGGTLSNGELVSFSRSGTALTTYNGTASTTVVSTGSSATFNVTKSSSKYSSISLSAAGTGYKVNDTLKINGSSLGGDNTTHDIAITVNTVANISYTNISATNVTGSGSGATFNVTRNGTTYTVTRSSGGTGYSSTAGSNTIKLLGTDLGGASPANDITITITGVTSGVINSNGFTFTGTAIASNPIATFSSNIGTGATVSGGTYNGQATANSKTIYTGVTASSTTNGGSGATFDVSVSGTTYTVTKTSNGSGYTNSSVITINGASVGGVTTTNNLTITVTAVSTGNDRILVNSGTLIEPGMYVVSDTAGIPALTVVGNSYVSGSTTVPLTTTSGTPISLTGNISGAGVVFTKGSLRIYSYDGNTYQTYPYTGIAIRPSAVGYPVESIGVNVQIPSTTYQDQIQFTFANNTLPQELYPYAKIEVRWPTLTLAESIDDTDTIIKVNGTIPSGYPEFGNVRIGTEKIYYGYRTDTYFGDCVIKFTHTSGDTITHSPNYTIKPDGLLYNGCTQNNNTKLIVMSATPSTGAGYSPSGSSQTVYVAGLEMDRDSTNAISFPSTAKYSISSDKFNYCEVTVNRTGNSITIPGGAIKDGETLNDGDEIILNSSFGLGSGYKVVQSLSSTKILINKPTISDTTNTSGVPEYRRLFTCDSDIISGMNDTFIDTALSFNAQKGLKYVGLSGCTDFKPVKCTKIKYATATSNKYSNTVTLADDIAASTYTLTGLSNYYSSGSTKASGVKSVLFFDGEDYEIKSINGRTVTLVQPLKQRIRFRDTVTIKSDSYVSEFERVPNVKGLVYGPQKAIFYDRYRAARVTSASLGYNRTVNRYRWRLSFTYGVPAGIALNDKISTNLNYNDYYVSCLPSSSELGSTTTSTQIIVSSTSSTNPVNTTNQNIIYISKPNGYVSRDFESASMQIGGYKNASRQQIVGTQVISEATDGAIADIESVSTRATRDIFTTSLGEVLGRFLFKQKNFASSNRPNLWRNDITSPASMNVKTGNVVSYLLNGTPTFTTFQVGGSRIFTGNSSSWSGTTVTGTYNNIGIDYTNSRLLFACSSNTIRYSSFATPTTLTTVTITGSGTNQYITYANGYYFVGNSTGGLYYSSNLSTWYTITTGNTSKVVGVYYDEFKYVITHEQVSGSGLIYKNYTFPTVTGANMNISTPADKIQGITNIFSPVKTISSVYGFGKILESGYDVFDGSTYSSPITEVYEYENFSDYTSDTVSGDFETKGLTFNFGQFIAFGKQASTGKQFAKFSSNARSWSNIEFEQLISITDEITSVVYGGYNTYIAIVWNSSTSSNKILVSNVSPISNVNLTGDDLAESGRYRKIEESESVRLYKYKTTTTSQEGNLLIWNSSTNERIWFKSLFGSPLKSNEFTEYKALAAENFVTYTKGSKLLPNFRSSNDNNGATRAVTIYNEKLPLGSSTVSTVGSGYEYGLYTDVEILNGSDSSYGSNTNRALATVLVGDTGTIISATITSEGDYYPTNTNLQLVSGTGFLEGDPTTQLEFNRTITKSSVSYDTANITTLAKTGSWSTNGTTITVTDASNIQSGMEVFSASLPQGTYYVSGAYSTGTSIPIVDAFGVTKTITQTGQSNHALSFRRNFITIPAGGNVKGIIKGMSISGGSIPAGTVVGFTYVAKKSGDDGYEGPTEVPITKYPPTNFISQTLTLSSTAIGTQASITTASTALDSKTFTLNGFDNLQNGYCVLYRNSLNGIDFIALFFNSQGVLVDCISDLKAADLLHLSRTEMFAQAL